MSKMDNKKKSEKIYIAGAFAVVAIVFVIIPLFTDAFIFGNNVPSSITNGEWASFLGSYLGGVLGGVCTLFTVLVTVRINNKLMLKAEEERLEAQKERLSEEKKAKHNIIVSETIDYISDVQVFIDIEKVYYDELIKILHEGSIYHKLKEYYNPNDNWRDYFTALEEAKVSVEIPKAYSKYGRDNNHQNRNIYELMVGRDNTSDSAYFEYGKYLDSKIQEYEEAKSIYEGHYNDGKRKYVIGNLHLLFLETTLQGDADYVELLHGLRDINSELNHKSRLPWQITPGDQHYDLILQHIDRIKKLLSSSMCN